MALIEINKNPSKRELQWFGPIFALFFALVGVIILFKFAAPVVAIWIWIVAGVVITLYELIYPLRRPLYLGWMYAAFPIGWVMSHLVMAITYYLVLTPIGLIMRLCGSDPMCRRFDREAGTYWVAHRPDADPARYFQQF